MANPPVGAGGPSAPRQRRLCCPHTDEGVHLYGEVVGLVQGVARGSSEACGLKRENHHYTLREEAFPAKQCFMTMVQNMLLLKNYG